MTALVHLSEFLRGLPHGLDSYPELTAKASTFRPLLDGLQPFDHPDLPPALRALVRTPPPVTTWVPEVHFQGLVFALRDLVHEDDSALTRFCYERWLSLFRSPLYRVLLSVANPTVLVRAAAMRWGAFHRGSALRVAESGRGFAIVEISHAPGLWTGIMAHAQAEGVRATLDIGRKTKSTIEVTAQAESLRMEVRWR